MLAYIIKRILWIIPFLVVLSFVAFGLIQLPPGDYLTVYAAKLAESEEMVSEQALDNLRERWGLDEPFYVQYWKWVSGIMVGDFGHSFEWQEPVADLIGDRLGLTLVVSGGTLAFTWLIGIPIGIYSAVKRYSIGDYIATFLGFVGLSIPNFLLALVLMYIGVVVFGQDVGGLFSPEYVNAPWSFARVWDMLQHLWVAVVVVGTAGTAGIIRIMRANLLDELNKPYVMTARAKGLAEFNLLMKYPVRIAMNPIISMLGFALPQLISGVVITAVVLNLPTAGPLMLQALQSQDMFLGGAFVLLLSSLTVVGMLLSDILLVLVDPRIRYT